MSAESVKLNIGPLGESLTCRYLRKHGYTILSRNYRKTWGEIDIVAEKNSGIHFVEVKAVSRESTAAVGQGIGPEENIHKRKIQRLERVIHSYLQENRQLQGREWQLDAALVWISMAKKEAKIELLENIGE